MSKPKYNIPAALAKHQEYLGKLMTTKEKIDLMILDHGWTSYKILPWKPEPAYKLTNGVQSETFKTKAEKDYIDHLISSLSAGKKIELREHAKTIQKIKEGNVSSEKIAESIASDHLKENLNAYAGELPKANKGEIINGPSHKQGGVDIVVNGKPVINAQGGESIVNAEATAENCEELSRINQSAGGGVAFDCGPKKAEHGATIPEFKLAPNAASQTADTKEGNYYVDMISQNNKNIWLLAGPYATHAEALANVDAAKEKAIEHDRNMFWSKFGTLRMKPEYTKPGILTKAGLM